LRIIIVFYVCLHAFLQPKKGVTLPSEELLLRGSEEKFLS